MNPFVFWQYAGWALFALIAIGILYIIFGMYRESQVNKGRDIAAPVIRSAGSQQAGTQEVFKSNDDVALTEGTRRSRRNKRNKEEAVVPVEATDASNFFDDGDDDFTITSGKD